jgi:hypothetical protein
MRLYTSGISCELKLGRKMKRQFDQVQAIVAVEKNAGSLYLSSRYADSLTPSATPRAGTAAGSSAQQSARAIPNPSRAAPDPGRVHQSIG